MARLGLCLILSVGLAVGVLFAVDPSLDLKVARLVNALKSSGTLDWAESSIATIRDFNVYLIVSLVALCTVCVVVQVRYRAAAFPPLRACVLILLAIAIGPGLIVNAVLKENWSRPRPGAVLASGDDSSFRAWWDPSGNCKRNCSFASGEASAAFSTLAVAVVTPLAIRYTAITLALLYGILIGAIRVAAAGHFVSDVVFAGVISALVVWGLHGLIYRWPATQVSEEGMRTALEAASKLVLDRSSALLRTVRRAAFGSARRRPSVPDRGAAESSAQARAAS